MTNFSQKIFKRTATTRILFFLIADILLISFSIWLAFILRFDGQIPLQYSSTIRSVIILALFFSLPIFYFLKLYSFSWSYVSTRELISLLKATTLAFLFLGATIFMSKDFPSFSGFPRSTLFISYFLVLILSGGIRISKRLYFQVFSKGIIKRNKERTLIVGAGDAGEQILRSILVSRNSSYLPIGFIDDDPTKRGIIIHGCKVLGTIEEIAKVIEDSRTEGLIIALPSVGSQVIKRTVELGRMADLKKIRIVPLMGELMDSQVSFRDLREIQVEDLLGREPVLLDPKSIEDFIENKVILITGAAGSIGSELSRQIAKFNPSSLLMLDQDETGIFNISEELKQKFPKLNTLSIIADIKDREKINQVFSYYSPQIVFHAAAYKHVPLMEFHPEEAVKNNIFGTKIIAETALKCGADKFIFISTDKAVNPTSVMGATKRTGEMICQVLNQKGKTKFTSVRFGNVLDSRGSVIPTFKEQIRKGGPVEVTHPEMKRYFMVNSEAVLLVIQAGSIGSGGEVFALDMGEPIKILDLAKEMIQLSGFEPDRDIPIVFTKPRPGEKLFEEILTAEEGTMATQNQKIFTAKLFPVSEKKIKKTIEKLKLAIKDPEKKKIVGILQQLVPSYKPNDII